MNPEYLDEDCTVILFGADGATDPLLYGEIVGRSPGEVFVLQEKAPVSPMTATP
ncbi:hypothetical protein ABGB14_19790 [Nonomuraea sp. B10E15]|uniref:hypothetical protein n=1 Tax=Nonomuraea sp. B10E15 TaxID=3153560 RepID=UPI00325EFFB2